MPDQEGQVMAAVYDTAEQAQTVFDTLQKMHKATTITLIDSAIVSRDAEGKLDVQESDELTVKEGAVRGAAAAGVLGLIFPPSLLATVIGGGAIGAIMGKFRDTGIKNDQFSEIATHIDEGKSAVVALAAADSVVSIESTLKTFNSTMITQPVSDEVLKQIYIAKGKGEFTGG